MGGSSAGKVDICFYQYYPGRSSERKRLVKDFLIVATSQGRRFGSAGSVFISAPVLRSGPAGWPAAARKFDICFYLYCPGAKQQKKEAG
jgi:hypothetical protein